MEIQTLIMAYANQLAHAEGFKHVIKPITEWKRPTVQADVAVWKLTSAGVITASETCVLSAIRIQHTFVQDGARAAMLLVFADIALKLNIETVGEVIEVVEDSVLRQKLMEENEIDLEQNKKWTEDLSKINSEFNIPASQETMEEHIITFIMAMRCDPTWDYDNTMELTLEERQAILAFVSDEEGAVITETDNLQNPDNQTPKKP